MIKIPNRLCWPEYRFYLVSSGGKIPIEKNWNEPKDGSNYMFHDSHLEQHSGNLGVCCGIGDLVVLDFDSAQFYQEKKDMLPETFMVRTATKRLPHLYYIMAGEMIRKTRILAPGKDGVTLCDIQGARSGVVCPGSTIGRRYYEVEHDVPLATTTREELEKVFGIRLNANPRKEYADQPENPEAIRKTIEALKALGIRRTALANFCCPFHESKRMSSLTVFGSEGLLHCFHCGRTWTIERFAIELSKFKEGK